MVIYVIFHLEHIKMTLYSHSRSSQTDSPAACGSINIFHNDYDLIFKVAHYCKVRHIGQIKREAPTHLPELNRYNCKTNRGMNMKVADIIQYYACNIADVLD